VAERFDVVNESDEVIGTALRSEVHGNPSLIHRVAHVLVFSSSGAIYLQLRAESKDIQPGKWDTSVGGHVDAGESYEDAAKREMSEELNMHDARMEFLYRYLHSNEIESEMVSTFRTVSDNAITPDPVEIAEGRFWTREEIAAADRSIFTPNFLAELERYDQWLATR
jgi:isopentenyldiphosphate isomerase